MLHVVFGAGQIGTQLAEILARQGHEVRVVRRSAKGVGAAFEVISGDAQDPAFAARAAEGAAVIYHCMNPSQYTAKAWEEEFPRQGEALIHAALANDARLVLLDNLYGYGVSDEPRTESTPMRAEGRKGKVRIRWAERLERARKEQGLRCVAGRAGDFFGPGTTQTVISDESVRGLARGKALWIPGDITASHAFSFAPDVAAALAALGTASPDVEGQVFHLPVLQVSAKALVEAVAKELGVQPRVKAAGGWMIRALAPFVPLFREVLETLYQWDRPFLVDDGKFRARFPGVGISLEAAAAQTAQHAATGLPKQPALSMRTAS